MAVDRDPSGSETPQHDPTHPSAGEFLVGERHPKEVPEAVKLDLRPRPPRDEASTNAGSGQTRGSNLPGPGAKTATGVSFSTIFLSAVLSLLMGGVGAWAYQNYVAPRLASQEAAPAQDSPKDASKNVAEFKARVDDLSEQMDGLKSRVDAIPKPAPTPDLEPIQSKLSTVDALSKKVDKLGERLDFLPKKIDQDSREIADLTNKIDDARKSMASLKSDSSAANRTETASRTAMKPAAVAAGASSREDDASVDALLTPGVELFQSKRYKEASEAFSNLSQVKPDDARVWYYAALSRGFATGDWKGETERLVRRGVDREKAGTPPKPEIDSAFAGLTHETGKDWLSFYRRRAAAGQGGSGR